MLMSRSNEHRMCGFCGKKSKDQPPGAVFIDGPGAAICSECVVQCVQIIVVELSNDEKRLREKTDAAPSKARQKK